MLWRVGELVVNEGGQETRRVACSPGEGPRRKKRKRERRRDNRPARRHDARCGGWRCANFLGGRNRSRRQGVGAHRLRNILERLFAAIDEFGRDPATHLIIGGA